MNLKKEIRHNSKVSFYEITTKMNLLEILQLFREGRHELREKSKDTALQIRN